MLPTLLFIAYLLVCFTSGDTFIQRFRIQAQIEHGFITRLALALTTGLALHLLLSHSIAFFITHSFRTAAWLSMTAMLLQSLFAILSKQYSLKDLRTNFCEFLKSKEVWVLVLALLIAISCGIRGHLTDSDNTHIPWMSGIVLNDFYPPSLPVNKDYSLTFYHYGIDLFNSSIFALTHAMPWDAISMQVGIGSFLVILSLYAIFNCFFKSFIISFLATIFTSLYTSIMALEFAYKFGAKFMEWGLKDSLYYWQQASMPSIGHIPYFLVLISQNVAIAPLLLLIILFMHGASKLNFKEKCLTYYPIVILLAFMAYFCYDAFWYVTLAGLACFSLVKLSVRFFKDKENVFKSPANWEMFFFLVCIFIAKYPTFQSSLVDSQNVNALLIQPSLYWDHFAMQFLNFFPMPTDNHTVLPVRDWVSGKTILNVYWLSMITFRNFGFLTVLALLLATYRATQKKFDQALIFIFAGMPGIFVPFLIEYVLKPSETYRFPAWSNIMFLIYVVIITITIVQESVWLKSLLKPMPVRVLLIVNLLFFMIPGVVSIIPNFGHVIYGRTDRLTKEEKIALKEIMKIHKSGEIAVAAKPFYWMCDIANVAGFYGVGGQWYKPDLTTRVTAIKLMNPILLKELGVSYILIDKSDSLTENAQIRLRDPMLFEEITEIHNLNPDWHFYRFINAAKYNPEAIINLQDEYRWVIGSKIGYQFQPLTFENNMIYIGKTKQELSQSVKDLRQQVKKQNIPTAYWLEAEAMTKEDLRNVLK